jgi:hypothetical protein
MKDVDGRAALSCWPVETEIAGRNFMISSRPAIDWILPLLDEDWLGIVPGLVSDDDLSDLLSTGEVQVEDCIRAARDATATASGMLWWSAVRLVQNGVLVVDVSGALVLAGVNPREISLGAYVAAVYRVLSAEMDKKARTRLDHDIEQVPPGIAATELYDPVAAASSFEQMFSGQGRS